MRGTEGERDREREEEIEIKRKSREDGVRQSDRAREKERQGKESQCVT